MKITVFTLTKYDQTAMINLEPLKIPMISRYELERQSPHCLAVRKLNSSEENYTYYPNLSIPITKVIELQKIRKRMSFRTFEKLFMNHSDVSINIIRDYYVLNWEKRRAKYIVEIEDSKGVTIILEAIKNSMESMTIQKESIDKKERVFYLMYLKLYYESLDKT